jgi:hypothetical protein
MSSRGVLRESRRRSYAPSWRLNRAAKGMRYQLSALGGQLARKLPKFFIRGGLQKHFDAVERRAVEFIGRAGQHKQPVKCELPSGSAKARTSFSSCSSVFFTSPFPASREGF